MKIKDKTKEVEGNQHTLVLSAKKKKQENRRRRAKRTDEIYDKLPETGKIELKEGHITFYRHFKYMGAWVVYNLCNDVDVHARITNINAVMDKLKSF